MRKLAVVASLLMVLGAACGSGTRELSGFVRTPPPDVSAAVLPDASSGGDAFDMRAEDGGLLIVYFGYTSCPDVCPTTLADLRDALTMLGDQAEHVRVAMVTIDPGRDSGAILTKYVQSFIPGAVALRTDNDAELRAAADIFGADYGVTATDDGKYEVFHTAHVYAVDDAGLLRVTWTFGTEAETIADDVRTLLEA
jgi:protein SCO1/2